MNLRDQIRKSDDIKIETLVIPEWGDITLYIREMTGNQRDEFEQSIVISKGKKTKLNMKGARARLAILTTYDANGDRVFTEEDSSWLGDKSSAALSKIYDIAAKLSGITEEDLGELVD